jgi:HEAT repeat protein
VTAALTDVVVGLAALVVLLNLFIIAIRIAITRRRRRGSRLRPRAELSLAVFLAGDPAAPRAASAPERAIMLEVALEALTDLRGAERARLVAFLEEHGYVAEAIRGLSARRRVVRRQAAETLAAIATSAAVPALTAGLADHDARVRITCACTLAEIGGQDVVPAIVATAERDVALDPGGVTAVVIALGMHRPAALTVLFARDTAPAVRIIAITVAGELRLSQHAALLQACLADSDAAASRAARGLGLIGEVQAVGALLELTCDTSRAPPARAAAATALGLLGDPSALPALEEQLVQADWPLRAAAAEALSRLGEPGIAALRKAVDSDCTEASELAAAALQR